MRNLLRKWLLADLIQRDADLHNADLLLLQTLRDLIQRVDNLEAPPQSEKKTGQHTVKARNWSQFKNEVGADDYAPR